MRQDIERFVARCTTCQKAKSRLNPHGLYMPLPVPTIPWTDISVKDQRHNGRRERQSQIRDRDGFVLIVTMHMYTIYKRVWLV
jgi:hypothetical protein